MVRQEFHGSFGSHKRHAPKGKQAAMQHLPSKEAYSSISLGCEKIHACPNHCILYRKEYEHYDRYPVCKRSRYKRNDDREDEDDSTEVEDTASNARKKRKIPTMVMWYLHVVPSCDRTLEAFVLEP